MVLGHSIWVIELFMLFRVSCPQVINQTSCMLSSSSMNHFSIFQPTGMSTLPVVAYPRCVHGIDADSQNTLLEKHQLCVSALVNDFGPPE